jgi:hypothetical protein
VVTIRNTDSLGASDIIIKNASWSAQVGDDAMSADVSMDTEQVTELTINIDDPNFSILNKSNIPLGAQVIFRDLKLSVASVEVNDGGGEGGMTIKARPDIVRRLKNQRGSRSMHNVSPSAFVAAEVHAASGTYLTEPSAKRATIARDVTPKGQQDDVTLNSWSTIQRLAGEIGFIAFEMGGVIYFGKPSWFLQHMPKVTVDFSKKSDDLGTIGFPTCNRSLDNEGRASIDLDVPLERANSFRPGYGLVLKGIPRFSATYFIKSVSFPVVGDGTVHISAETPHDPNPTLQQKTVSKS